MNDSWVLLLALASLLLICCGLLAAGWARGRLGWASAALFVVAVVWWVADFAAITSDFRDADGFVDCRDACTATHRVTALGFVAPPLLVALSAAGMIVARLARRRRRAVP